MKPLTADQARTVEEYHPHVRSLARRLARQWPVHVDRGDVEQLGMLGLMAAVQRFNPAAGANIWTFAQPHVRGSIIDGLRRDSWPRSIRRARRRLADPNLAAGVSGEMRQRVAAVEALAGNTHAQLLPEWVHGVPSRDPHHDAEAADHRRIVSARDRAVTAAGSLCRPRILRRRPDDASHRSRARRQRKPRVSAARSSAPRSRAHPHQSWSESMKRLVLASLLVLTAACGLQLPPQAPPPVVTPPTPIEAPAPQVAILTVIVDGPECGQSTVFVGEQGWPTRPDCSIVEEFAAGEAFPVSASAAGYLVSQQQVVTMTAGSMPPIRIALERIPAPPVVEPPVLETPVEEIPPAAWVTIRRFVAAYPFPTGDGSDTYIATLRHWTRQLAEQLRYSHGPEWGHKSTSPSSPPSKEAIARKIGPDLHVWDMLVGAASGRPTLAAHPSHYHVNEQHFIDVTAVDHLANAPTGTVRPRIPQPWIGLTSFDLGARLEAGDRRWVDMMVAEGFTVARVVVASVYRTPRTLADGLRQLPLTLSTLAGAGLRAEVVVLVDTRDYGMTRQAMRDYLRQVVAICEAQPAGVAGVEVCGGIEFANENTHGGQVEDLADPVFLRELEALVPARFATSCGSSHGGEAPFVSACSYVTHHADRDRSPEENAAIMAQAQQGSGKLVVDDEALGIAEEARPGARTNDPAYGERQARAARQYGLAGVTLHIEAGLTADVDKLGPVQRDAIRRFVSAMRAQ